MSEKTIETAEKVDLESEKMDMQSKKMDEMQLTMSEFMTQMSNTVNSLKSDMSAQTETNPTSMNFYSVLDDTAMDTDSLLGKRNEPPSAAEDGLRDGGKRK